MPSTVAPNLWDLTGNGIHVRYSTVGWPGPAGGPHLLYQAGGHTRNFSGNEIRVVTLPDLAARGESRRGYAARSSGVSQVDSTLAG
jgi:hypothetical protein